MPAVARCPWCNNWRPRDEEDRAEFHCDEERSIHKLEMGAKCRCNMRESNMHPLYCFCTCVDCSENKRLWAERERANEGAVRRSFVGAVQTSSSPR